MESTEPGYARLEEVYLTDMGEAKIIEIDYNQSLNQQGQYAGNIRGNINHLSPELYFKFNKREPDYYTDIFKNDVYGFGILAAESIYCINFIIYYLITNFILK